MSSMEISKNDVYETGLKYDYVKEKLENHKDLKDLYNQVLGLDDKENKKIEDLSGVKTYLDSIKDKSWNEIKQEGATWSFAVQLFLKSQGLYDGRIDGLYMTAGQPESKTRAAVRKFQEANGLLKDGWAGPETIKKMLEVLNKTLEQPEADKEKIKNELKDILKKNGEQEQRLFREGKGEITDGTYNYVINDGKLIRHIDEEAKEIFVFHGKWIKFDGFLIDDKGGKKEIPVVKKEVPGATPGGTEVPVAKKVEDLEKTNKTLLESKISGLDFNGLGVDEKKSKELFLGRVVSILNELNLSFADLTSEHINGLFTYLRKEKVIGSRLAGAAYQDNIDYGITKTNSISAESIQKKKMEQNQKVESLIKDYFSKITLEK